MIAEPGTELIRLGWVLCEVFLPLWVVITHTLNLYEFVYCTGVYVRIYVHVYVCSSIVYSLDILPWTNWQHGMSPRTVFNMPVKPQNSCRASVQSFLAATVFVVIYTL